MKIAIGCDHAGFAYKAGIVQLLTQRGIEVLDFGTNSAASVDYPDFAHPVARAVSDGEAQLGIVLCGIPGHQGCTVLDRGTCKPGPAA